MMPKDLLALQKRYGDLKPRWGHKRSFATSELARTRSIRVHMLIPVSACRTLSWKAEQNVGHFEGR